MAEYNAIWIPREFFFLLIQVNKQVVVAASQLKNLNS